jgi:hypothetical protein
LPSRLIRHRLAYAKPHARNSPDGPDSCEITRAITLVHLTTGTFNHFVKDPIALRLSGAFQVPQVYLERKPWSSSKLVVSPAPKSARDEPFKLTPSGCFLSMWISLEIRGESLLSRLCQAFLDLIRIAHDSNLEIQRPLNTRGPQAPSPATRSMLLRPCPYAEKHTRKRGPLFNWLKELFRTF